MNGRHQITEYERFSFVAWAREWSHRILANRRFPFGWNQQELAHYLLCRRLFLAMLGAIYFTAFVSLWTQLPGLVGKNGILPVADLMTRAHETFAASGTGIERFRLFPTLCWFSASDGFVGFHCAAGAMLSLLLIGGVAPPACLALMWVLYLSLSTCCREFLGFQWDNLLLETGLLAILFAPAQLLPRPSKEKPPSRIVLWLLRLLLFKLMFLSGVVKLASGDQAWHNLTALTYHYQTQPLPNWIAWHVHQFPLWFQKGSCIVMFGIELVVPFLIFAPRRARMAGGLALVLLQILILLTGNYTFFNWLTLALCLLLFDDSALSKLVPRKLAALYSTSNNPAPHTDRMKPWGAWLLLPIAAVIVSISVIQLISPFTRMPSWTSPLMSLYGWLSPFRSVNSYGLFAVMTTERPEIIVEGSNDGLEWKEYGFRYKPGDLNRRPSFVAPHQPRLDWQMWFAALGSYRQNPWFVNFCVRLLQGSPEVLALMKTNPFPDDPPKYIRARLYDYKFTSRDERGRTGAWWKRELKGEYLPTISLEMIKRA